MLIIKAPTVGFNVLRELGFADVRSPAIVSFHCNYLRFLVLEPLCKRERSGFNHLIMRVAYQHALFKAWRAVQHLRDSGSRGPK